MATITTNKDRLTLKKLLLIKNKFRMMVLAEQLEIVAKELDDLGYLDEAIQLSAFKDSLSITHHN